jgi:hypothetical protein
LRRQPSLRLVVLVTTLASVVVGACDVLFVAVAGDVLGGPDSDAGVLSAGFGLGAVLGAASSVVLVGRQRLTPFIAGAAIALGVPMLAIAGSSRLGLDLALFAVIGGAGSILRVATLTMVQRVAPRHVLARVFGIVEGLNLAAMAIGSALVAVLAAWLGVRGALVALGLAVPALVLVRLRPLLRIDATAERADPSVLDRLRAEPILAPLGAPALEALAVAAVAVDRPAGIVIVREGEPGSWFYVLESGRLGVTIEGRAVRELEPPSSFGEIALLRDVPRTATITALTPVQLRALHRDDFLEAVTGHPASLDAAEERTNRLLGP